MFEKPRICFDPEPDAELARAAYLQELAGHLVARGVELIPFSPDMQVSGLIAVLASGGAETYQRALYAASELNKPVLALWPATDHAPLLHYGNVWALKPSKIGIAKVAIDVFLESRCGYRVPLNNPNQL